MSVNQYNPSTGQLTPVVGTNNHLKDEMVAPYEATTTASRAYAVGDQFIYNQTLYTVTVAIESGGTITVGTNCVASDSLVDQIKNTFNGEIVAPVEKTSEASRVYLKGEQFIYDNKLYTTIADKIPKGGTICPKNETGNSLVITTYDTVYSPISGSGFLGTDEVIDPSEHNQGDIRIVYTKPNGDTGYIDVFDPNTQYTVKAGTTVRIEVIAGAKKGNSYFMVKEKASPNKPSSTITESAPGNSKALLTATYAVPTDCLVVVEFNSKSKVEDKYSFTATFFFELTYNCVLSDLIVDQLGRGGESGIEITYAEWSQLPQSERDSNDYYIIDVPVNSSILPISGLTMDTIPTQGSTNPVESNGIYETLLPINSSIQSISGSIQTISGSIVSIGGRVTTLENNEPIETEGVNKIIGDTSVTFTHEAIQTASELHLLSENASNTPIFYTAVSVSSGSATYTFPALTEATTFSLVIK